MTVSTKFYSLIQEILFRISYVFYISDSVLDSGDTTMCKVARIPVFTNLTGIRKLNILSVGYILNVGC